MIKVNDDAGINGSTLSRLNFVILSHTQRHISLILLSTNELNGFILRIVMKKSINDFGNLNLP